MKMKRIISLVVPVIISTAALASCAVTPKASAPQGMDVTARVTETPEGGRGAGGADDTAEQSTDPKRTAESENTAGGTTTALPPEIGGDTELLYTKTAKLVRDKPSRDLRLYGRKNGDGYYEEMLLWISDAESGEYLYGTSFEVIGNLEGAHIVLGDANFDGYTDVMVTLGAYGSHGHFQYFLLPGDGGDTFQNPVESFYDILNPVIDARDKVIRSLAADSAFEDYYEIYRYEGGEFRPVMALLMSYEEENGKTLTTYTPYEYVNGVREPRSVCTISESPDPHHPDLEQYYGEGSLWKLDDPIWYDSAHYKGVPDDTPPQGSGFSGVVQKGRFYHYDRGLWFDYYYMDVGQAQYDYLREITGAERDAEGSTEIQLYSAADYIPLEDYIGQRIRFDGMAYAAESIYHRRDIVFDVKALSTGELEAPLNLRVTYQTELGAVSFDRLTFTYDVPDSIARTPNVDFRVEMRENGGEWITADSEYPEPYLSPTLTQSITGELICVFYRRGEKRILALEQNRYEFRACFSIGNMERSDYTDIVTLGYE